MLAKGHRRQIALGQILGWGGAASPANNGKEGTAHPKDPGHSAICVGLLGWEAAPLTTEPSSAAVLRLH